MKQCKKCKAQIPHRAWIDGKRRVLTGRSFCLDCSPFGKHNTRDLTKSKSNQTRTCKVCNKQFPDRRSRGDNKCQSCWFKERHKRKSDQLYSIVGEKCWICGYDKGRYMLDFHHINPDDKEFALNARTCTNLSWKRVIEELMKCILVCCRCHREIHCGLIENQKAQNLFENKWEKIGRVV